MQKIFSKSSLLALLGATAFLFSTGANAQEWPLVGGDLWEVTGIEIKDGGGLKYANWLASEWREGSEFAKSKGWIKDYMIFANEYGRKGEPDLYLVRVRENLASSAEGQKRAQEYREWRTKSVQQMQEESGNRAEYRTVASSMLLRELMFRK